MNNKLTLNLDVDWEKQQICLKVPKSGVVRWNLELYPNIFVIGDEKMAITITSTQKVSAAVQAVDSRGNPALVEDIVWSVNDENVLDIFVDEEDPTNMEIFAVGPLGNAQVTVVADADLGEGVVTLQGILDVTVVSGQAVALEIATGIPEEQ